MDVPRTYSEAQIASGFVLHHSPGVDSTLMEFCWIPKTVPRDHVRNIIDIAIRVVGVESLTYLYFEDQSTTYTSIALDFVEAPKCEAVYDEISKYTEVYCDWL